MFSSEKKRMWLVLIFVATGLLLVSFAAYADADPNPSSDVVIIGGTALNTNNPCSYGSYTDANVMLWTAGGCLPVSGPSGELGDFTFTAMTPGDVSAANLAGYDTAVLNVASYAMACNTNNLTADQQADLVAFVESGKKLIIYDSECYPGPVDYSWLTFPFTTANPGALGAQGTLTIVEENSLSSNDPMDPYYIDAAYLGSYTDAVGDMNVMTTYDANWCLDMSGTNAIGVSGPVHTYAKSPSGTDTGLIIYNGLDQDYQTFNEQNLRKIWVQELQQSFNPSNLPCGFTVVGITLEPASAENNVGEDHTVTATLSDLLGSPQPGIAVEFSITSGPNAGATGVCAANSDCTTDANGEVSFTYTGDGGVGVDSIVACFTNQAGDEVCSQTVTKEWLNTPPVADPDGPYMGAAGAEIVFDGSGSYDPDGDALTYSWDFGDSGTGDGVSPSHAYSSAGIYDVCLTVDDGYATDSACTYAIVYDPSAGFVTGGGWIYSPAGAYKPDASLEGKANFGFVAKYKKGANVPDGQTEFQFKAGELNFHSSSYDWLIVTGSNYARFKGLGTINGELAPNGQEYKFMLWAGDGTGDEGADTFRIKIWYEEGGSEFLIYDNGMDQAIDGGSIVVHTK